MSFRAVQDMGNNTSYFCCSLVNSVLLQNIVNIPICVQILYIDYVYENIWCAYVRTRMYGVEQTSECDVVTASYVFCLPVTFLLILSVPCRSILKRWREYLCSNYCTRCHKIGSFLFFLISKLKMTVTLATYGQLPSMTFS